jgi:GNAT superfamily N-acetyltransferase
MVRNATLDDIPVMLQLAELMHAESQLAPLTFCAEKVEIAMRSMIADGFAMVHEKDGEIDGGMLGYIGEPWYSRVPVAGETGLFVRPDKRGGLAAWYLLSEFVAWAMNRGAKEITLAISTGVRVEETGRLYQRLGFKRVGGVFIRRN